MRVLLVDDEIHVRSAVSIMLQANHFEIVEAESGAVGLKKFKKSTFDLAIVDIYIPGMDGVRIIKALRSLAPNLPIIAMSGMRLKLSDQTALDYLSMLPTLPNVVCLLKPFRPDRLTAAIQHAISAGAVGTVAS